MKLNTEFFVTLIFLVARVLRGKADFPTTLRVVGFASSAHFIEILGFIPLVGVLVRFIALLIEFFGIWIGEAAANELKGWRAVLLPVFYVAAQVVSVVFLASASQGIAVTYHAILHAFGVAPP